MFSSFKSHDLAQQKMLDRCLEKSLILGPEGPKPGRAILRKKSPFFEILRKTHPIFFAARIRDDVIHRPSIASFFWLAMKIQLVF